MKKILLPLVLILNIFKYSPAHAAGFITCMDTTMVTAGGKVGIISSIHLPVLNSPPAVSIITPVDNQITRGPVNLLLKAAVSDPDGTIIKLEFYEGTSLLHTERYARYSWEWENVPPGDYVITAKAYDDSGAVTISEPVHISIVPLEVSTVSITDPIDNATYTRPADIRVNAIASKADGTISKVEFYDGTTLIATERYLAYTWEWQNVAIGKHTITAKAYYIGGLTITSAPVHITVLRKLKSSIDSVAITYTPLSNTSGPPSPPYYTNYLPAANTTATVYRGDRFELSLKVNNGGSSYNIGVWVDYNNDNIFHPSENVILTSRNTATGSNWAQVPLTMTASTGKLRIRVSSNAITANDCCSILSNGEIEDYTLTFNQAANCRWIGRVSADWNNPLNWSCGIVPDATKSVMIPAGTLFNSTLTGANATIDRLWIQPGATIIVNTPWNLNINGTNTIITW
ncbi:MAG: Ig-like domain-containing protein [Ginsengibacter sp.]